MTWMDLDSLFTLAPLACLQLQGKTDQKFVEVAFRLFRDCFAIKTVLTPAHFLEQVRAALDHGAVGGQPNLNRQGYD